MDDLFPLPIEAFEYYYLCDDRPDYPTTFPFELTFSGRLERGPFEIALNRVLPRHPMLTACIDLNNGGRPNWIACEAPSLDWAEEDSTSGTMEGQRIDLTISSGLRVIVRQATETARVVFEFHHASCDGRGAIQFVEEVLLAYHAACNSTSVSLPPLDPLRLRARADFGGGVLGWWAVKREVWRTIAYWMPLLLRSPRALAAAIDVSSTESPPQLPWRTSVLDRDRLDRLRASAAAQQVAINDLLLRDLLLVIAEWNREHGDHRGWLRINVPISRPEKRMPAATLLNFNFITRSVRAAADPQRLLESIRRETERMKRDRRRPYYVYGLTFACGFRGLVPWVLSWKTSFATIVMSNVGSVFSRTALPRHNGKLVCGAAVLERVAAVPPIRPLTRASIAVLNYAGEMTVTLRCDSQCFRTEHADDLLAHYVARLDESAGAMAVSSESTSHAAQATQAVLS